MAADRGEGRSKEDGDGVSRDFCCFMCNGRQILQGYVTLFVSFVRLTSFNGKVLEEFEYGTVYSVNEEEPPTTHSLIIHLPHHSVYLCHLLRKRLLLRVFQKLNLYKPDVRLPAESLGFPTGGLSGMSCSPNVARLVYPIPGTCHHHHHHHYEDYEDEHRTGSHGDHYAGRGESRRHWNKTGSRGQHSASNDYLSQHLPPS